MIIRESGQPQIYTRASHATYATDIHNWNYSLYILNREKCKRTLILARRSVTTFCDSECIVDTMITVLTILQQWITEGNEMYRDISDDLCMIRVHLLMSDVDVILKNVVSF